LTIQLATNNRRCHDMYSECSLLALSPSTSFRFISESTAGGGPCVRLGLGDEASRTVGESSDYTATEAQHESRQGAEAMVILVMTYAIQPMPALYTECERRAASGLQSMWTCMSANRLSCPLSSLSSSHRHRNRHHNQQPIRTSHNTLTKERQILRGVKMITVIGFSPSMLLSIVSATSRAWEHSSSNRTCTKSRAEPWNGT